MTRRFQDPRKTLPPRPFVSRILWSLVLFGLMAGAISMARGETVEISLRGFPTSSVNVFRVEHGRRALAVSETMTALAAQHSYDMANRDSLDHNGFMEQRGPAGALAENVSYGCANESCAIRQWARSAGHRLNMLLSNAGSYGLASAVSKSGKRYWTMEIGH